MQATHLNTLGMLVRANSLQLLEVLNLSINRFGVEGMLALSTALGNGSLPRLLTLDLTGNVLGSAGAEILASILSRGALPGLEVLKLGRNGIGDQGLVALARQLRLLPELRDICLHSNGIGDEGIGALLANLRPVEFRQLRTLNLRNNRINDAGCSILIEAFEGHALLTFEGLEIEQSARLREAEIGKLSMSRTL